MKFENPLKNLLKKNYVSLSEITKKTDKKKTEKVEIPQGYVKCPSCSAVFDKSEIVPIKQCPKCGGYFRMSAKQRLNLICDKGSGKELFNDIISDNPLNFPGYEEKISQMREKTGLDDSVLCVEAEIDSIKCAIGIMDSRFIMGSLGSVTGEKLTRLFEYATEKNLPVIVFTCSGGARMQEGCVSLMQMGKVSASVARHSDKGLLYISVITDPTTGGVTASYAMLGDIILSEPKALIGFAGRRVIEQTIKQKLPDDFQSAEFMLSHGFLDAIVERKELKDTLAKILKLHTKGSAE